MFDFDNFREIWSTVRKNKLRTFLTGFSVAWGIFMLIVLLGAGNGLHNGVMYNFRNFASNRVEAWTRYTTKPWKGMQPNRSISFKEEDLSALKRDFPEVDLLSATISHADTLTYNKEYITGQTEGVYPDHARINYVNVETRNGRFINEQDMRERRKVIVLSPRMAEVLFRDRQPLGEYVRCGDVMFQVVGVYNDDDKSNNAPAYIPFSVAQLLYNKGYGFGSLTFTLKGVVTDGDIRKFILQGGQLEDAASQAYNYHPISLPLARRGEAKRVLEEKGIDALPILDTRGRIADIVFATGLDVEVLRRPFGVYLLLSGVSLLWPKKKGVT